MLPSGANMLPRQVLARLSVSALVASLPLLYVSLVRPPPAALAGDTAFWFLMSNCVVAAIVASDDAGTLFFGGSSSSKADHDDNRLSYVADGDGGAVPQPFMAPVPPNTLIQGEDDEGAIDEAPAPTKPRGAGDLTSSVVQRGGQEDATAATMIDKWPTSTARKKLQGPPGGAANDTARSVPEPADAIIVKADDDGALAGPEPWPSVETTGMDVGLEDEYEMPEAWAIAQQSRTPDLRQRKGGAGEEGRLLRRSATEGSRPRAAAAEETDDDYWKLSDEELNRRVEEFIARFNREMRRQIEQDHEAAAII